MKQILVIAIALFSAISFAQTQQKPSELVAQEKSQGADFKNTQLFTKIDKKSDLQVPKGLQDYVLFSVDQGKLKSLYGNFPNTMNLSIPGQKSTMSLDLVKVNVVTDDFSAIEMPSGKVLKRNNVAHYRGIVKNQPNSLVAISFYDDKVSGLISIGGQQGNLVVGPVENSKDHILYQDKEISYLYDFACQAEDDVTKGYTIEELADNPQNKAAAKCVKVFFDICTDIVNDKGGAQSASNYIEAVFNQVAALYANDQISLQLSGTKAWVSNQPFSNNNLDSYINYRNSNGLNGDLGHMVNYSFGGGLAGGIGTLCNSSRKYAVSGINGSYSNIPTYSFDVFLISHELGHNVGSRHTHACVWNGNNTAIDGCAGFTEGGCSLPGNPSGGGTIMSYCPNTSVGVNFNNGFGSQPANVIRNYIAGSSCLQTCDGGGCNTGDPIAVTFTNNSDCTLQYYQNNTLQGSANAGGSYAANTTVGTAWQARKTSGDTFDNFTMTCGQNTYNSTGTCSSGGGNCDGVAPWSPNVSYSIGDRVTYNGYLYELTSNGWQNLGACTSSDPCAGVAPWSSTVNYSVGDRVTYNGSLYERTATGWTNLGPCGASFAAFDDNGPAGELRFTAYPNPVEDILNIEISNLKSSSQQISIKDMNGRTLDIIALKTAPGGGTIKQSIDVSKFSSGVYFVQMTTGSKNLTHKIFVK
ncbi:T9SS type A sorting domain-containing protein [Aquimarina sp. 2201CG5-10]|uniref:T9SS type A sorting domain-containing protein n=1 Tax=Aquimarina callyspongiae TaxID=3098150 RepID=UPI002AB3CD11|nr:T9SS type A sorting domain-containing protein [Aquimarina sp. 2201CG5-10]MDY8137518.1 T9SS type A sorting domain-containing protein [Aquimarina sp. 2201CG5-10]